MILPLAIAVVSLSGIAAVQAVAIYVHFVLSHGLLSGSVERKVQGAEAPRKWSLVVMRSNAYKNAAGRVFHAVVASLGKSLQDQHKGNMALPVPGTITP